MHPVYRTGVPLLPEYAFHIFSQQIYYLIILLDFLSPSSFIPPQNAVYFLTLSFLVRKIFTFYINGVLNCKCAALGPKGECKFQIIKDYICAFVGVLVKQEQPLEGKASCSLKECRTVFVTCKIFSFSPGLYLCCVASQALPRIVVCNRNSNWKM